MYLICVIISLLTTVTPACKPRVQRDVPQDSHDHNSETINTGLIAISKNSGDGGIDVTDVIIYCIAGILCLSVAKWLKKACNRRLNAVQTSVGATAPQPPVQPLPPIPQAPAIAMPLNIPALPAPTYSVVYRSGHGREEACITEDKMQQYR